MMILHELFLQCEEFGKSCKLLIYKLAGDGAFPPTILAAISPTFRLDNVQILT